MHVPEDVVPSPERVARTYRVQGRADAFEAVTEYQRVLHKASEHPNKGSAALSTLLELPRGRIRGWVDGDSRPDPVRGIEIADSRGWFVDRDDVGSARGQGLAALVGWVLAGGSVSDATYQPLFICDREGVVESLRERAAQLDIELRELERGTTDAGTSRAPEFRVRKNGTVFGRVLAAAGAPVGGEYVGVPEWIDGGPDPVKAAFTESYLLNRATLRGEPQNVLGWHVESRPRSVVTDITSCIVDLVGGDATVGASGDDYTVTLDRETTDALLNRFDSVRAVIK